MSLWKVISPDWAISPAGAINVAASAAPLSRDFAEKMRMLATSQSLINLDVCGVEFVNHKPAHHNIYGPEFERLGAKSGTNNLAQGPDYGPENTVIEYYLRAGPRSNAHRLLLPSRATKITSKEKVNH